MYCLRVFIVVLQEYYNVYHDLLKFMRIPSFSPQLVGVSVSYMPSYISIIIYGLRLFIVVLQELQCCLHVDIIRVITSPSFVRLELLVSEIAKCIA